MKTLHGIMHECSHPDRSLWFEPDGGETFQVKGDADSVPTEVPMEIHLEGDSVMAWSRDEAVMAAPNEITYDNVAIVYCNGGHVLDEKLPVKEARQLQNNGRRVSHGTKNITYTPYIVQDIEISTVTGGPWTELIDAVSAQKTDDVYHNGYLVLSPRIFSFCGNAYVGGSKACANPGTCPDATQYHEDLGHRGVVNTNNRGDRHSGGPGGAYGDKAGSWMGAGGGRSNWLAAHLYYGGVITEDEVIHLEDGAARAFLVDPEIQPMAMRPGEHKAVFVAGDIDLCVSFHGRRAYVHRKEPETAATWISTWWLDTLNPGDVFDDKGVHVEFVSRNGGAAEIVVSTDGSAPEPAQYPQWILPNDSYPVSESWGVWRNKQWSFQGIPVHVKGNHVAATWYTWDRNENPIWFIMQGDIDPSDDFVRLTIYATDGERNMWEDGEAIMYFYSEDRGMFKAQSEIMGRTCMPLDRLTTKGHMHPMNGLYSAGNRDGFSIFASVNPDTNEEKLFLWNFTYTEGSGHVSPAKQNWLHGDGAEPDNMIGYQPQYGHPEVRSQYAEFDSLGLAEIIQHSENDLTIKIDGDEYPVHRLA